MKALFVGLGAIGQRHLRNLYALLGSELQVYAYRRRGLDNVLNDRLQVESDQGLTARYGIRVLNNLDDALAERPDIVLVCNPTSLHLSVALEAARAGCNLFIEKPLSHDLSRVPELIELVESKGLVNMVGYQLRFHPALLRVQQLLAEEAIGRIIAARAQVGEYLPNWHTYEDYRGTYGASRELGGGALLSQIHEFDYIYWLFGLPSRVFTLGGHLSSLELDVEDVASTLMECERGGQHFPVHLQQDYVQRPPARGCEIVGDKGKITLDLVQPQVHLIRPEQETATWDFRDLPRNRLFIDELNCLLFCLKGSGVPPVDVRTAAKSLRIALAAKKSMETGRAVDLEGDEPR